MPAQIAHILHGLDALSALDLGPRLSGPAFRLGCQGPDVFYHNRRTKPGAFLFGTRLHRRGWGTVLARFRASALDRGWGPDHPGLAFLAGQATHAALDRALHPFIVYHAGWKVPGDPSTDGLRHAHAFLERILDLRLWESRTLGPLEACPWQDQMPGPGAFPPEFWAVWADALHSEFPRLSLREDLELRLKNAVADTQGFLAYTSPTARAHGRQAALHGALHYFHPIDLPAWDFENRARAPWRDPLTGEARTESFEDLFEGAVAEARTILGALGDPEADFEALVGNENLNLPGLDDEHPGPRFCRPWDFGALYEREVAARLSRP